MRWVFCKKCKNPYPADDSAIESDKNNPPAFTCTCDRQADTKVRTHMITPDIQPYKNIVTGTMINSRKEHREMLKQHHLEERPDPSPKLKEHMYKLKHSGAKDVRD
jgi:hypothetical protein